jgi:DNA-binding response OmpR family regulator
LKPAKGDASLNAFPEGTKRLLFVDSELGFLRSFKQFFQENGFELVSAKTGREALRVLASQPYDAVVFERYLPDMDGFDLLARIRVAAPGALKIMLASWLLNGDNHVAIEKGADAYLTKPVQMESLLTIIKEKTSKK